MITIKAFIEIISKVIEPFKEVIIKKIKTSYLFVKCKNSVFDTLGINNKDESEFNGIYNNAISAYLKDENAILEQNFLLDNIILPIFRTAS